MTVGSVESVAKILKGMDLRRVLVAHSENITINLTILRIVASIIKRPEQTFSLPMVGGVHAAGKQSRCFSVLTMWTMMAQRIDVP